jgi:hypothetical protein
MTQLLIAHIKIFLVYSGPAIDRQTTVCSGRAGIVDYLAVVNPACRRWSEQTRASSLHAHVWMELMVNTFIM